MSWSGEAYAGGGGGAGAEVWSDAMPPRAGGGGQPMQAACAKSGMLAGRLRAAQDGTRHEREGKDPHPRDKKNLNQISTTKKGLTSAGIPTELNDSTAGVPTG
jgi:hypothetical protein